MPLSRTEVLRQQRDKVLKHLAENKENRAKWLTLLMDIDDEFEEIENNNLKLSLNRTQFGSPKLI